MPRVFKGDDVLWMPGAGQLTPGKSYDDADLPEGFTHPDLIEEETAPEGADSKKSRQKKADSQVVSDGN